MGKINPGLTRRLRTASKLIARRFCLLLLFAISIPVISAYDFESNGIYYNISGENAIVTYMDSDYNSYSVDIEIPATVYAGRNLSAWGLLPIGE